jgi:hypothetical protein
MSNATYTYPTVTIGTITFTAKRWGQFPTIQLTSGAVAGSEVATATLTGTQWAVAIQIASGTSTDNQIIATLTNSTGNSNNLNPGDLVSATTSNGSATESSGSVQTMTGAIGAQGLSFYSDQTITALTASFVFFPFNGDASMILIKNNSSLGSGNNVVYSFDGVNVSGTVTGSLFDSLIDVHKKGIFLKYAGSAAPNYIATAVLE